VRETKSSAAKRSSPEVPIQRAAALAVRRGHPWVFREGLGRGRATPTHGALIDLIDDTGAFVARALYDAASPIAARALSLEQGREPVSALYAERIGKAIARRARLAASDTNAYRLCHGEGDRAPGLVIDRYAHVAIVKVDTRALDEHLPTIIKQARSHFEAAGITSIALRGGGEERLTTLEGSDPPERIDVIERGMTMEVDLAKGQKTGAFLDQRDNRARVRELAKGCTSALNLFSYAGGFSIAAALGGAERVTSVDIASGAHATAQRSFKKNDLDPTRHAFVTADAFAWLGDAKKKGLRFDLVVSDPPSFAPSEHAKQRALVAYRKLHEACRGVLAPGGVFCAASCSSHVTMDDFFSTLDDASLGDGLSVVASYGPPEDHPTLAAWPEGRYLKLVVLR
jgi:23S rRNA (cytosine1962-C5)-methyltransferase